MNPYLARLRNLQNGILEAPSKPSKPSNEGFGGVSSIRFFKNQPAREAFPYAGALAELDARCPDYVEVRRWRQCVRDAERFIAEWGNKADALGWTAADLLALPEPPKRPHPSYDRLARYDCRGLLWSLQGQRVVALSADSAAISTATGGVLTWRKRRAQWTRTRP